MGDEQLGIFEISDKLGEDTRGFSDLTLEMTKSTTSVGEKIRRRTEEINNLNKFSLGNLDELGRQKLRVIFGNASEDLTVYSSEISRNIPEYRRRSENILRDARNLEELYTEADSLDSLREQLGIPLFGMIEKLGFSITSLIEFRGSVKSLLPLTASIRSAKKAVIGALSDLIEIQEDFLVGIENLTIT